MPSLFDTLTPASLSDAPEGYLAFRRDQVESAERDRIDAEVIAAGGQIVERMARARGLRPGRMLSRRQPVSYYLVPLEAMPPD